MRIHQGEWNAAGLRFGIAVARFNDFITKRLLDGCLDALRRHGAPCERIEIAWVPGSFELPLASQALAESGRLDAVVALGCVIRGETAHFEHVAGNAAAGLAQVGLKTNVPVVFGVLTTDTLEQAIERAGGKAGNKGHEAALTAIEMANLLRSIRG